MQPAPALTHHLRACRRKEGRTPELAGTLATATSLRSRGGRGRGFRSREGGGGLRSKEGPTYLIGAAAVVLVSGVGSGSRVDEGAGVAMEVAGGEIDAWREGAPASDGSELVVRCPSRWGGSRMGGALRE